MKNIAIIQVISILALLAGMALAGYWYFAPFYTQAFYGSQGFVTTTPEANGGVMHHITDLAGNSDLQASRLVSVVFGLGIAFMGMFGLAACYFIDERAQLGSRTRPV
jgi:hypothetical protein